MQRLDDLVFEYIRTINKLRPKVALLENVKGIILGNAKAYAKKLKTDFETAGYKVQVFILNAATMGVPQKRERVFFIGLRKDINLFPLKLEFNEAPIPFNIISKQTVCEGWEFKLFPSHFDLFDLCKPGKNLSTVHPKKKFFSTQKANGFDVLNTITADDGNGRMLHFSEKRYLNNQEYILAGTFPQDFNFNKIQPKYIIGMSVPPVMTAQIAHQIWLQWLSKTV